MPRRLLAISLIRSGWWNDGRPSSDLDRTAMICRYDQVIPQVALRIDDPAVEDELKRSASNSRRVPCCLELSHRDRRRCLRIQAPSGRARIHPGRSVAAGGSAYRHGLAHCWIAAPRPAERPPPSPRAIRPLRSSRRSCIRIAPICCAAVCSGQTLQVIQADALHLPLSGRFDRVLADVPCSGTGTLARNPEIKWRLSRQDLSISTAGKSPFFARRWRNSRSADALSIPPARWSGKKTKR